MSDFENIYVCQSDNCLIPHHLNANRPNVLLSQQFRQVWSSHLICFICKKILTLKMPSSQNYTLSLFKNYKNKRSLNISQYSKTCKTHTPNSCNVYCILLTSLWSVQLKSIIIILVVFFQCHRFNLTPFLRSRTHRRMTFTLIMTCLWPLGNLWPLNFSMETRLVNYSNIGALISLFSTFNKLLIHT